MKRSFGIILILAVLVFALSSCGKKEISLDNAFEIIYKGDSGEGIADILPNHDAIIAKLDEKQRKNKKIIDFIYTVNYRLTPDENLSNGQEIEVLCSYNEEMAKKQNIEAIFNKTLIRIPDDAMRVVRHLTEKDVFDGLKVKADGIYPDTDLSLYYEYKTDLNQLFNLEIINRDFAKGVVTVEVTIDNKKAGELGFSLKKPMRKDIEIGEYSKYLNSAKGLSKEEKERISGQAKNVVTAYLENEKLNDSWVFAGLFPISRNKEQKAFRKIDEIKVDKVYFICLKDGMEKSFLDSMHNQIVFIYKAKIYHHEAKEGQEIFIPVKLENIIKLSNGNFDYKVSDIEMISKYVGQSDGDFRSLFMNRFIDKYDGEELSFEEYMK